ncbi:MAG: chitobiase/beta-hexosaminidase C-terminal domain-containing protein, partial [Paludibacteraceae bacterium]|nr:chitobiase/beta-hexosaminidase C-terminal domain-containing protein [Paludibacteraceae bacterium]
MKTKILLKARWLLCGLLAVFLTTNAWADEKVYKTALFGSSYNSKSVSSYTDTWTATNGDFTVSLSNFNNNNNGWAFVKCGRKNATSVGTIITDAAIDKAVTKVVVTIDAITAAKVSIKLYRSTNKTDWTEESSFSAATGAQEVAIGSANQAANLYYKVEFDCASGSSNGFVTVSKVEYYAEVGGGGSSETTVKTLKSIAVSGMTTSYEIGDAFSFNGTCTATYSVTVNDVAQEDEVKTVTPTSVSTPDMTEAGEKTITVTYTEDEVEKSTTYNITVSAPEGDKLTLETTGVTGNSYVDWNDVAGASGAVYAGQSAGGNSSIQLRSKNNNSGIISTTSGGLIKKVKVVWNSNTSADATLNVYGSNNAYAAASDLYGDNKGTLLGTIVNGTSTQLEITDDYEYVGVRSNNGAMYLTSVTFVWGAGKELESIAVTTEPKTSYIKGEAFDATGLVITATYNDESTTDIAYAGNEDKFSFSGFDSSVEAAAQTITVTYGGKSTTYNVEIKDITLQTVTVSGTPTTTSYTAGDSFDPTGLTVMGHYSDNSDAAITDGITWSYPDGDETLTVGQTSIRVIATVDEFASEAFTVNGLDVAAAPLVATWVASEQGYEDKEEVSSASFGSNDAFTITFDKGTNSNKPTYYTTGTAVRIYGGGTFTLSSADYKFKEIVIGFGTGEGSNAISTEVGTYKAGTWTGNSKEVVFTIGGTSGHRRIAAITVTYEEALPSAAAPTFSPAAGTYFDAQNVTITSETAGATIYYTTDGTEPTTSSNVYSEPIAVSTDMTIKAIAVIDGLDNSAVATAEYAMGPVFASLEALAAADLTSNTMVKVSFSNVAIKTIDASKHYVTFDIQKEDKDIEIYFNTENLPVSWVVGGTLSGTILAPWKRYALSNNLVCWELAPEAGWSWTDLTYTSPITKDIDHVTVTGEATKTTYVDGEVFDPAGLTVTLYYTDETNEVVTEGILWAPTTALTVGMTSVDVTATVENTTSAVYPVSITVSEIPTKTIAEFIAAGGGRCYLIGVVSTIANSTYGNFTLTDASGSIYVYGCLNSEGEPKKFAALDVEEGDRIKVIAGQY